MPYITPGAKHDLINRVTKPYRARELTFLFFEILNGPVEDCIAENLQKTAESFMGAHTVGFQMYAEIIGAASCATLEYGRRVVDEGGDLTKDQVDKLLLFGSWIQMFYKNEVGPYEDKKREENGDIAINL